MKCREHRLFARPKIIVAFAILVATIPATAQVRKTENIFVVTTDGFRWKELFNGAERKLLTDKRYVSTDSATLDNAFWAATSDERRKKLMPFFWNTIANHGQLYGNRSIGNLMNVKNIYRFSYPGYNEIFTGYPDSLVNSNDYPPNPNENVLEFINRQNGFKNKVSVFASWNAYYRILNSERSGLYINSGWSQLTDNDLNETQQMLNEQQPYLPRIFGSTERLDASTFFLAKEHIKKHHPRVFYLALIDTDAFGHQGKYDLYLNAAHNVDAMINDLWSFIQHDPFYKDKTTLIVTTDHGRGENEKWTGHYSNIEHSDEIWMAVMGPDTKPLGEIKTNGQVYQQQVAATISSFLGMQFKSNHPVAKPIESALGK
ncbi:MAG: alkaline phosphatase family protein [Chitinophagaceae bacterium]|nr:alkaline phosphatase family protein [Chitinophagaceae bacterium]